MSEWRTPSGIPWQTFFHSPYQPFFLRRLHLDALRFAAGELLRQRPVDMFVQHGVLAQTGAQCEHDAVLVGRIAQRHGDIAQPAQVADAAYRRAFGDAQEFFLRPVEQIDQLRRMQRGARAEIVFVGKLRKAVPRADQLAVVAAVDAVAEQRAELLRDRAFQLDGQVGDAAPGVYGIGGDDGAGRAG